MYELITRLTDHHEGQKAYYERQLESAEKELARLALLGSGQLSLWEVAEDGLSEG